MRCSIIIYIVYYIEVEVWKIEIKTHIMTHITHIYMIIAKVWRQLVRIVSMTNNVKFDTSS